MPIQNMAWHWGPAGSGGSVTLQVNFPPQLAVANASLSGANGGGLCMGGIKQFRIRPAAGGPDQETNFGWSPSFGYPPVVFDTQLTSVTAELVMGGSQSGVMTLMVWLWT